MRDSYTNKNDNFKLINYDKNIITKSSEKFLIEYLNNPSPTGPQKAMVDCG